MIIHVCLGFLRGVHEVYSRKLVVFQRPQISWWYQLNWPKYFYGPENEDIDNNGFPSASEFCVHPVAGKALLIFDNTFN